MKHTVNGKSFDEIFAQRGEKVEVELKHGCYYITDEATFFWSCLFVFDYTSGFDDNNVLSVVSQNGRYSENENITIQECYEATPDQIDLLNSYKKSRQMANLIAIAPKKGKIAEYLTNGKEYPITVCDEHGYYFRIIDDEGCEIFCTSSKCSAHLHGLDWTIKEATTDTEKNVHDVKERT